MSARRNLLLACAFLTASANWANAEIINENIPAPGCPSWCGGAYTFTVVLQGTVPGLNPTPNNTTIAYNTSYNAFYSLNQSLGYGTTSVAISINGSGNTVLVYTGSNAINNTESFGTPNPNPHFAATSPTDPTILNQYWGPPAAPLNVPGVSVTAPPVGPGYTIIYVDATAQGLTVGQWFEFPGSVLQPIFTNNNGPTGPVTLSDAGYQTSFTEIPLSDLNFSDEPPPGNPGSPFIPLPQYNGRVLNPSPEPSMWIPLASGLICIGRAARRRFKNAAVDRR
jgi:hypothetical protein